MELINYHNIKFTYPGVDTPTLCDVNFAVNEGEFALICGPSGCGKTTLLKQLIPSVRPYGKREGQIIYDNQKLEAYDDRTLASQIGYVAQNPNNSMVTDKVWHELAFGMENLGMAGSVMERRIAEVCEFFGLQKLLHKDVVDLSGGEMQLVHLAAVMVVEPKVLLLDEPTAYLDPLAARTFLDMLKRINTELGTTIIIVEHHLEEVYGMADKVIAMSGGRVDEIGTPREVASKLQFKAGLPSALLIAREVSKDDEDNLPLTVAEGQKWMKDRFGVDKGTGTLSTSVETNCNKSSSLSKVDSVPVPLSVKNIAFAYDDSNVVLTDCNLTVYEGEVFALLGGNGTGKSTLLNVLCNTLKPSYGKVYIFGKKITKDAPLGYEGMVYLPQDPMALFTEITVEEELIEALDGLNIDMSDKKDMVLAMIDKMSLNGLEKMHPYDLSSGQQQILALSKLLLLEPKIILMDEPTKGLDYERKKELGDIIKHLSKEGVTILMVSHDIEFCAEYAHRCAMMHDGRIVAASDRRDFFAGNKFFTTASNRIARLIAPRAILPKEVIAFCLKQEKS